MINYLSWLLTFPNSFLDFKSLSRYNPFVKNRKSYLILLLGFLLPTQFGKHFFLSFSYLSGVRIDYLAPTIYVLDLVVVGLYLAYLNDYKRLLKNVWIQAFLLATAVGLFFAFSKEVALYRYIKTIELLVVFASLQQYKKNPLIFLYGLLASTVLQFFIAMSQFVQKASLDGIFYFLGERHLSLSTPGIAKTALDGIEFLRAYGTFSHPNSMAGFYLLLTAFLLFQSKKILPSAVHATFLLLNSLLIILSFSKVAIFGLLLLTIKYFVIHWKDYKNCIPCVISRLMAILIPLGIIASSVGDPLSGQKRVELMQNALNIISLHPFTGVGLGNYVIAQESLYPSFSGLIGQPVHNIFLLLTSEFGVLITSALIVATLSYLKKNKRNYQVTAVFFVLFLTGMFDHYWITLEQNWLLVASLVALL